MSAGTTPVSMPVRIARATIESFVRTGNIPAPDSLQKTGFPPAGCFVSLKKNGALRGCIGTIGPTMPTIEEEIVRNAVAACSEDPRFDCVTPDELDSLVISVDILGENEPVSSVSELDPAIYGVIVTAGFRRGLLLPDLEGVDTVADQLAIACRKGGISPDEPYRIQRFRVTRYH